MESQGYVSAIFFQNCLLDVCDWVEAVDLAKGPIIVKALQRKHKRVEKELVPIKDVVDSFTDERGKIKQRTGEVGAVRE